MTEPISDVNIVRWLKTIQGLTQVSVIDTASVTKSITAKASGNTPVWTPVTGKKVKLKFASYTTQTSLRVFLQFGTSGSTPIIPGRLPGSATVLANFLGAALVGSRNQVLNVNLSARGTVDVFALGDEVS